MWFWIIYGIGVLLAYPGMIKVYKEQDEPWTTGKLLKLIEGCLYLSWIGVLIDTYFFIKRKGFLKKRFKL